MHDVSVDGSALWNSLRDVRRHLHAHPELAYAEHATADFVAERLQSLGLEVDRGLGGTGVVAVLRGTSDSHRTVGLRADMDALPITERAVVAHASRNPGVMHACGHDGHTAMLLGAAEILTAAPPTGTVVLIFQPAEEGQAGARAMIRDGLFRRFPCDFIFALHNWPELPPGEVMVRSGPIMAASGNFDIKIKGKGGHAGFPHRAVDPVVIAGQLIGAIQTLVSRNLDPAALGLISVTQMEAGRAYNVIPPEVCLKGTLRAATHPVRNELERGLRRLVETLPPAFGAVGEMTYDEGYPATVNDPAAVEVAIRAVSKLLPPTSIREDVPPSMGGEDFAYMLEEVPGAYLWIGQGGAPLHSPDYDFNDDILPLGARLLATLAATALEH